MLNEQTDIEDELKSLVRDTLGSLFHFSSASEGVATSDRPCSNYTDASARSIEVLTAT